MNKKRIFFTVIFLFCAVYLVRYLSFVDGQKKSKPTPMKTYYKKKKTKEIVSHPTTTEEKKLASIPEKKRKKSRKPSSLPKTPLQGKRHEGRRLFGQTSLKSFDQLEYLNRINPEWEELAAEDLLRFQFPGTKVMIKKNDSVLAVGRGKARYLEEVTVTYVKENGEINSFKALIDSQTGKLGNTWARTIHHQTRKKPLTFAMP